MLKGVFMLNLFAFRDKKSGVLSNHFISADPIDKVKQSLSVSLLQLSFKEPTNPLVLYANDYDLIHMMEIDDYMSYEEFTKEQLFPDDTVSLESLLVASRSAYDLRYNHTSPDDELNKNEE